MDIKNPLVFKSGQSLIEVLLALAIVLLVILALVRVVTTSIKSTDFAKKKAQSTSLAQEGMEKIRAFRDQNSWEKFKDSCQTFNPGSVSSPFSRKISCQEESLEKIKVTVLVSWTEASGTHQSELISYFTKWQ